MMGVRIILVVVAVLAGLKLLTRWTDRKGWTSFHKAEEFRLEIHDEEDGDNRSRK